LQDGTIAAHGHIDFFLSKYGAEAINSLCSEAMAHFQGRSDGIFCAYRATDGKRLWDFDAGTGIMAPATYLQNGVQYITLMAGWGGAAALANIPGGGPIKRGYGSVPTFSLAPIRTGSSAVRTDRPADGCGPHESLTSHHPRGQ